MGNPLHSESGTVDVNTNAWNTWASLWVKGGKVISASHLPPPKSWTCCAYEKGDSVIATDFLNLRLNCAIPTFGNDKGYVRLI